MTDHKQESKDTLQAAHQIMEETPSSHFTDAERVQILASLSIAHALQELLTLNTPQRFMLAPDGTTIVDAPKNVKGRKPSTRKAGDDGTA